MTEHDSNQWLPSCPTSAAKLGDQVTLAHGEGGRLMRRLIRQQILSVLDDPLLRPMDDATRLPPVDGGVAVTTDSFVVSPLFFPGGDIGSLSVYGTVNDLAVSGADPLYLTVSLIIEEGLTFDTLGRVLNSLVAAARRAEVRIVAGDTKVVPRGAADGLFINTTGVGRINEPVPPGARQLTPGDVLIVSGAIGRHGIAVMCAREELGLEPPPQSDAAPLTSQTQALLSHLKCSVRAMRDATRGGVAAVLHEWAEACGHSMLIREQALPISSDVRGVCELLGLDPLHVANEGTMVVAVAPEKAEAALSILKDRCGCTTAAMIGHVVPRSIAAVTVLRQLGIEQPLDDPLGAPLPRIC